MANDDKRGGVGAGAEAAAGIEQAKGDSPDTPQGERTADTAGAGTAGTDKRGSEPITHDHEHQATYGGAGGAPRPSSGTDAPSR